MVPFLNGIVWALMGMLLCSPTQEATEILRPFVLRDFKMDIDNFDYLGGPLYTKSENGTIQPYFKTLFTISTMSVVVVSSFTFSFAVILYCGTKCYLAISESANSQSIQSQLFYALVIQTLIPTLLLHFPVSIMFGFVFADNGLGMYSSMISITISLYPAIDPLPNFFIITPYRKAVFRSINKNYQLSDNHAPPNSKNAVAPAPGAPISAI
ncbi:hypothetical protein CRE_14444 [Caenorhabditis remanei]|uniref:Seven TM Receptor n=1 Tax=Caenorhabditis remanei TaxID=31234 RepID=E3NUW2_CAERE|nr:hypothetical protein CRE_14444 [Caenorhabditis remanei]